MKIKKIAAVLLCVTTMASAPYVPVLTDTLQSFSISAEAADTYVKQFTVDMLTYSVYKTSSGSQYVVVSGSNTNVTNVNIPATITYSGTTYPIKKIASGAFQNKKRLATVDLSVAKNLTEISSNAFASSSVKTVVIGSSVTIQSNAFYNTTSLTTLTFQSGATKVTIAGNAFAKSGLLYLNCYAPEIEINSNAFGTPDTTNKTNSSKLKTVCFYSNTKKITLGKNLFRYMKYLQSVKIENASATASLAENLFQGSSVNTVTFPSTITSIPQQTFYDCVNLKSFTIPGSVKSISIGAFSGSGLTGTIQIGAQIGSIGPSAFSNLHNATAFDVSPYNAKYKSDTDGILYNKSGDTIVVYPAGKTNTSYTLTAKYITNGAFGGNKYLKELDLRYLVSRPSSYGSLPNLESIILPEGDARQSGKIILERYASILQNPKLNVINGKQILITSNGAQPYFDSKYSSYLMQNFEEYSNCGFMKSYVDAMSAYIVKTETTSTMTDMEKALHLHNWILENTTYDPNVSKWCAQKKAGETPDDSLKTNKNHVDASVFLHERNGVHYTVCDGYARCYNHLLKAAGIEAYYVHGEDTEENPINHAWNLVKINGNFYHVDVCWDDSCNDNGELWNIYKHFMKSDAEFNSQLNGHDDYDWYVNENTSLSKKNGVARFSLDSVGDLTGDGSINEDDEKHLASIINQSALSLRDKTYGDLDFDGDVDNNDLSMLKEFKKRYYTYVDPANWKIQSFQHIRQQLSDVCVANGATAKTTVEAKGKIVKYEWYYKNANMSSFEKTSTFTGKTYSVTMNSTRSGRQIYCVLTDDKGNTFQTNIVTLSMK